MSMLPFEKHFPVLANNETRRVILMEGSSGETSLPLGNYVINEWYCHAPGCDCRRGLFRVVHEETMTEVASINFGFERSDPMRGPFIDPLHRRAPYAREFLDLFKSLVTEDRAYVERCRRHYEMVKSIRGPNWQTSRYDDEPGERFEVSPERRDHSPIKPRALTPVERKSAQKRLRSAMKVLKTRARA